MKCARVSVVIPTRERLAKLRRALTGVERQTFRDFEVWVVDDGSTDGTPEYLRRSDLGSDYPGIPSIRALINERPAGAAAARNRVFDHARGELVAFLDDDDVWLPEYLERQVANLDRQPDASASYAPYTEVDRRGRRTRPDLQPLFDYDSALLHLMTENPVHTLSALVCRREAFDRIGRLDEGLSIAHDLDWYARLILGGGRLIPLPGAPLLEREIPGGLVSGVRRWFEEERAVLHRVLRDSPACARHQRQIRAHRALLFARLGIARKDYAFAAGRLFEALSGAPVRSLQIVARRLSRNLRPRDLSALHSTDPERVNAP
jgi:glycosyltransferase involved in cell wall biosynthesis